MKQVAEKSSILAVEAFGDHLAISTTSNDVNIYKLDESEEKYIFQFQLGPHSSPVCALAMSEQLVLAGSRMGNLKLWDTSTTISSSNNSQPYSKKNSVSFVRRNEKISRLAFHPFTDFFAVASGKDVAVYDARHRTPLQEFTLGVGETEVQQVTQILFSPDGQWIACSSDSKTSIWDLPSGAFVWEGGFGSNCLIYDPLELTLWTASAVRGTVVRVDLETWETLEEDGPMNIKSFLTTPDGSVLYSTGNSILNAAGQSLVYSNPALVDAEMKQVSAGGGAALVYKLMDSVMHYEIVSLLDHLPSSKQESTKEVEEAVPLTLQKALKSEPLPVTEPDCELSVESIRLVDSIPIVRKNPIHKRIPWNENFVSAENLNDLLPSSESRAETSREPEVRDKSLPGSHEFVKSLEPYVNSLQMLNTLFGTQPSFETLFSFLYAQRNPRMILDVLNLTEGMKFQSLGLVHIIIRCMEVLLGSSPGVACEVVLSSIGPFKPLIIQSLSDIDVSHEERRKRCEITVQALKEFKFSLDQLPPKSKQRQSQTEIEEFLQLCSRDRK